MIKTLKDLALNNLSIVLIIFLLLFIFATWAVGGSKLDQLSIAKQLLEKEKKSLTLEIKDSQKREKLARDYALRLHKDYQIKIEELKSTYAKDNKDINERFDSIILGIDTISFDSAYIALSAEGGAFN